MGIFQSRHIALLFTPAKLKRHSARAAGFSLMVLLFLGCVLSPAWAASPGLPFTEDFSDTALRDAVASRADWSTEEKAAYLKFITQRSVSDGGYGMPVNFGGNEALTNIVIFGDIEGDGDLDIAVAPPDPNDPNVVYLYDSATGTYGNPINIGTPNGHPFSAMAMGDVDGDGDLDIAVGTAEIPSSNGVHYDAVWFFDRATSSYSSSTPIGSFGFNKWATGALAFGDMDSDGDLDVVVGYTQYYVPDPFQSAVYYYDSSTGTYGTAVRFGTPSAKTQALAVGDVDQDGDLDIVAGNQTGWYSQLYRNNSGTGTFSPGINIGPDANTFAIALGDVDGDGDLDVALGNKGGQDQVFHYNHQAAIFGNAKNLGPATAQTAAIALGDIDGDGDLDAVVGIDEGFGAGGGQAYRYDPATGTFGNPLSFNAGISVASLSLGDLDHDGDLDIATAAYFAQQKVWRFDSNAGAFSGSENFGTGIDNSYVTLLADLDNDGDLDIAVGNYGGQNQAYFYDSNNGSFGNPKPFGTGSDNTLALDTGDVNGDGYPDIAVGNFAQQAVVYLYDPLTGTYSSALIVGSSVSTLAIVFGDFDHDGDLDLAMGGDSTQSNRVHLYDSATGTFGGPLYFGFSAFTTVSLALGDVNGDGYLDIAAGDSNSQSRVYLGNGQSFGNAVTFGDVSATREVAFGDVDNDGDLDLAVANSGGQNRVYRYDSGAGTFGNPLDFGTGSDDSDAIAFGDVDGDGYLDIVVGNDFEPNQVYFYDPLATTYGNPLNFGTGTDPTYGLNLGDVDGDGRLDIAVANHGAQNQLYRFTGRSLAIAYAQPRVFESAPLGTGAALVCADMDRDGDMDMVAGNGDVANAVHYYNRASGAYTSVKTFGPNIEATTAVAVGDVNGDGNMDIVVGNYQAQNKVYLYSSVTGTYGSGINFGTGTDKTTALVLADFDRDGDLDLAVGNDGEQNWVYTNSGSGVFTAWSIFGTGTDVTSALAAGDLNNDGTTDIAVGNYGTQNEVYFNFEWLALFSIHTPMNFGTGSDTTVDVALGDLVIDGFPDIAVANSGNGSGEQNRVYFNVSGIVAVEWSTFGEAGDSTRAVAMGDVDHDGDLDIVATNDGGQNFLYRNYAGSGLFNGFQPAIPLDAASVNTGALTLCDLDADGDLDVATGNFNSPDSTLIMGSFDTGKNSLISSKVNAAETNLARVTLTASDTGNTAAARNSAVTYYVSNNGGERWFIATPGAAVNFTAYGSDLRWKAQLASLSPGISPRISSLSIVENLLAKVPATTQFLIDNFVALDLDEDGFLSLAESGLGTLAELKPYDLNSDGTLSLNEVLGIVAECIFKAGFENLPDICE